MLRRRYEILLPLQYNDGTPVSAADLNQTREELLAHFGGVSIQPGTVAGIWIHEDTRYEDSLVRITVDVEDIAENRQFLSIGNLRFCNASNKSTFTSLLF